MTRWFTFGLLLSLSCATTNPSQLVVDHLYFCAHYLAAGLLDQAEARCELALELDRNSAHAYNLLGLIARAKGDLDLAARHFKTAIALDELPEVLNNYGEIFVERREWDDARDLFAQAIEIDPTYVNARANLAKALYYDDEAARAAKEYLKCTEQNPEHCECRLGLGVIAVDNGDSRVAITHFERLTQICPTERSFYNLCWAYLGVRRCSEASAACSRALSVQPGHPEAQQALARAVQCVAKQETALRELLARAQTHPHDAELQFSLGRMFEDAQKWSEALAAYNQCLTLNRAHVRAYLHAARVSDRLLRATDTVGFCEGFLEHVRGQEFEKDKAWCVQRTRELH